MFADEDGRPSKSAIDEIVIASIESGVDIELPRFLVNPDQVIDTFFGCNESVRHGHDHIFLAKYRHSLLVLKQTLILTSAATFPSQLQM